MYSLSTEKGLFAYVLPYNIGKITEGERQETLAPFALAGIQVNQVNRDYEAFFKTSAWGNDGMRKKEVRGQ